MWITATLSEKELLATAGMDALLFERLILFGLQLFAPLTVLSMSIRERRMGVWASCPGARALVCVRMQRCTAAAGAACCSPRGGGPARRMRPRALLARRESAITRLYQPL